VVPKAISALVRLVIDTNVVLSALLFPSGSLTWIRDLWQTGQVAPMVSLRTLEELVGALAYSKFGLTLNRQRELLNLYLPWCEVVTVSEPPTVPDCRDPADRPFLELATAAGANALVTGDNDVLALAPVFAIPILTPTALRGLYFPQPGSAGEPP
jgi:putative PIN family toxin of toxin-antitoxin system